MIRSAEEHSLFPGLNEVVQAGMSDVVRFSGIQCARVFLAAAANGPPWAQLLRVLAVAEQAMVFPPHRSNTIIELRASSLPFLLPSVGI